MKTKTNQKVDWQALAISRYERINELAAERDELLAALKIDVITLQVVLSNDPKNIAAKCCIDRNNKLIANAERAQS